MCLRVLGAQEGNKVKPSNVVCHKNENTGWTPVRTKTTQLLCVAKDLAKGGFTSKHGGSQRISSIPS